MRQLREVYTDLLATVLDENVDFLFLNAGNLPFLQECLANRVSSDSALCVLAIVDISMVTVVT